MCPSVSGSDSRVHPGADDVCRLWRAGVRPLLPIGCGPAVAQRLPALQRLSVRAADSPVTVLEGRKHLLPTRLLQVHSTAGDATMSQNTRLLL